MVQPCNKETELLEYRKATELQHKDEISLSVICSENRKNLVDGTRLNPKS